MARPLEWNISLEMWNDTSLVGNKPQLTCKMERYGLEIASFPSKNIRVFVKNYRVPPAERNGGCGIIIGLVSKPHIVNNKLVACKCTSYF